MGVPKFFRYISERYPNLSELVGIKELPQFDNMYLDMNGIIHVCSHPDDSNVHFRITEEQIFRDIFHYIDTLFRLIQPTNLFFMAVDGVAPRAKMNQQRGRRFRSAKEAIELIEKAKKKGEKLPAESRFDSNCITPGTGFMVRLQEALKHFVKTKISDDIGWRNCTIILSGHETPGEGEHKIMEYIRYLKSQNDYNPSTRHCLYGLDADLIMLGLCTHEHQFSLLREEVKFDKKAKRATSVDDTHFFLLHLGLLREYLELEFISIKDQLTFDYDIERIIDDWIFMCFLVGNDFIPHLPNLHINSNALPVLYKTYREVLPELDGYINENGKLNLPRLEKFMIKLGTVDRDLFRDHYTDLKMMEQKYNNDETFGADSENILSAETKTDLDDLVKNTMLDFGSSASEDNISTDGDIEHLNLHDDLDDEDMSDEELFEREFLIHKRNYYINKLKYPEMTEEVLAEQTECYITALQWTLSYYYRGVCSWGWYYSHHYAPYISDIKNFANLNICLEMGKPFLPFQQLLAVLPAASIDLLPKAYHTLMTDSNSSLIEYYPVDFETDLNGKKQEWEAVVLIPFIDETKLLAAMKETAHLLTDSEKKRNVHGPMLKYQYSEKDLGFVPETRFGQPAICHNFCKETPIWRDEVYVPDHKLVLGPSKGIPADAYFPGFPTMRHLKYTAKLKADRIKVFEQPSRNESTIIKIMRTEESVDLDKLASELLDKEVYVGWPHLREAKVVAVSDINGKIDKDGYITVEDKSREFLLLLKHMTSHYATRMGIDLGEVTQLVHVRPLRNKEYIMNNQGQNVLFLTKNWLSTEITVAPHTIVRNLNVQCSESDRIKGVEEVFTNDSVVFMINNTYYGSQGTIVDPVLKNGRLKVSMIAHPQPNFSQAKSNYYNENNVYINSYNAASQIGINNRLFSKITGTILIVPGQRRFPIPERTSKINVGLQLKFPKQNEELGEYTRCENNQWQYSPKAVEVVRNYLATFPQVFNLLSKRERSQSDFYFESDLSNELIRDVSDDGGDDDKSSPKLLTQISHWLRDQQHTKAARRTFGTKALDNVTITYISSAVEQNKKEPVKSIKLQVKPHLLYKPNLNAISVPPDASATFELFDRVVIVREGYSVPLGATGTIISIHPLMDSNPVRQENINAVEYFYDVIFDDPFEGGNSIDDVTEKRLFKVRQSVLLNISFGLGLNRENKTQENQNQKQFWKQDHTQSIQVNQNHKQFWKQDQTQPIRILRKGAENNENSYSDVLKKSSVNNRNQQGRGDCRQTKNNPPRNDNEKPNNKPSLFDQTKTIQKRVIEETLQSVQTPLEATTKAISGMTINSTSGAPPTAVRSGDCSDALRKVLGISIGLIEDRAEVAQSKIPETTPIDLNEMFKRSAQSGPATDFMGGLPVALPPPPLEWQTDLNKKKTDGKNETAQSLVPVKSSNSAAKVQPPASSGQIPPYPAHSVLGQFISSPPYQHPLQLQQKTFTQQQQAFKNPSNHQSAPPSYQHKNIPPFTSQGKTNFFGKQKLPPPFPNQHPNATPIQANNNFGQRQQRTSNNPHGPNGPQNLSNNSKYKPGQGAFIPLQAARKNVKPKAVPANQDNSMQKPELISTKKTEVIQPVTVVEPVKPIVNIEPAKKLLDVIEKKTKEPAQSQSHSPLPMRLAAKFNPPTA